MGVQQRGTRGSNLLFEIIVRINQKWHESRYKANERTKHKEKLEVNMIIIKAKPQVRQSTNQNKQIEECPTKIRYEQNRKKMTPFRERCHRKKEKQTPIKVE